MAHLTSVSEPKEPWDRRLWSGPPKPVASGPPDGYLERMTWARLVLLAIGVALACGPVAAVARDSTAADPAALPEVAVGRVAAVEEGPALVVVLEDGRRLRPALILAPPAEGGRGDSWPPAEALRGAAADHLAGEAVTLHWPEARRDRHGRLVGHLRRARDGLWLQEAVVAAGLALVMPFTDEDALAAPLLRTEAEARRAGRGLWADPRFAVRRAETVRLDAGALRLVEGRVASAAAVRGTVYLNFGAEWREDFTGRLTSRLAKDCAARGVDPLALEGRRLRLRGWLERANGPLVEVTACDQMEVLDD